MPKLARYIRRHGHPHAPKRTRPWNVVRNPIPDGDATKIYRSWIWGYKLLTDRRSRRLAARNSRRGRMAKLFRKYVHGMFVQHSRTLQALGLVYFRRSSETVSPEA